MVAILQEKGIWLLLASIIELDHMGFYGEKRWKRAWGRGMRGFGMW
jgi:hypothetical protein